MKACVDTNILARTVVQDERIQAEAASRLLRDASVIVIPLETLCELAWVLHKTYRFSKVDIVAAIETLVGVGKVKTDRAAVEAGLAVLRAGGDFADGVIAFQGRRMGGEVFVSFDRKAVAVLRAQGHPAEVLK